MKYLFPLVLCFWASIIGAQSVRFEPNWQKGDTYQLAITTVTKTWDEIEMLEEKEFLDPIISVEKVNDSNYNVRIEYTDVLQSKLMELTEEYNWEVEPVDLTLKYQISREDGSYKLLNYQEASAFMKKAFEDMAAGFTSMSEDESTGYLFSMIMAPLTQLFESEEVINSYFGEILEEFAMPFYKEFSLDSELKITDTEENPFSPGDSLSATVYYSLEKDGENGDHAVVNSRTELDFSQYMEMIKPMIQGMMKSFAAMDTSASDEDIDSAMEEINTAFDNMSMSGEQTSSITFTPKTGWPSIYKSQGKFSMNMGALKNGKFEVVRTVEYTKLK